MQWMPFLNMSHKTTWSVSSTFSRFILSRYFNAGNGRRRRRFRDQSRPSVKTLLGRQYQCNYTGRIRSVLNYGSIAFGSETPKALLGKEEERNKNLWVDNRGKSKRTPYNSNKHQSNSSTLRDTALDASWTYSVDLTLLNKKSKEKGFILYPQLIKDYIGSTHYDYIQIYTDADTDISKSSANRMGILFIIPEFNMKGWINDKLSVYMGNVITHCYSISRELIW